MGSTDHTNSRAGGEAERSEAATAPSVASFLALTASRQGHFRLESGHHGGLWLDLDGLFSAPERIEPFVAALAEAVRAHDVSAICGPLLGGAFLAQLVAHRLGVEWFFTERHLPAESEGLFQARYLLPAGSVARVRGRRLAIVDDVMSAGSALRGTYAELRKHGAEPIVAGVLLVLGDMGAGFFRAAGVPVEAVVEQAYAVWGPAECPLCAAGEPLTPAGTTSA
jgi:orotate phosphoribosyltransferase